MTKGSQTIYEYLNHAKSLVNALFSIQKPVSDEDFVTAVLFGLSFDFSMLITTILNQPSLPSFTNLCSRLLVLKNQASSALAFADNTTAPHHHSPSISAKLIHLSPRILPSARWFSWTSLWPGVKNKKQKQKEQCHMLEMHNIKGRVH
ncbi:unnamed protein product [Prunus brigantina]